MPMQIRPKGPMTADESAFYNPQRDLAYIAPNLFAGACEVLVNKDHITPWQTEYMAKHNISTDDIVMAIKVFRAYFNECADPANKKIPEAADKSGLTALSEEIKYLIWARVGQTMTGLLFPFIRTMSGHDPKITFRKLDGVFEDVIAYIREDEKKA